MKPLKFYFVLFYIICVEVSGQSINAQETHQLYLKKAKSAIKIDGILDEIDWKDARPVGDFWEKYPTDKIKAKLNTVVKATYDDKNLYFSLICFDSINKYVAPSLKRDLSIREADGIVVLLDPLNKKSNGFGFSTTPYNVQTEYQYGAATESNNLNSAWDNKWFSEVKRTKEGYVVEIAIPFKTLRYDQKNNHWGVNFIRSDQKNNKFYTWTNVPVQFPGFDLGYFGSLIFEEDIPKSKGNVSLIPYVTTSIQTNALDNLPSQQKLNAGFDAKVAITPSLNLDLTLNPDFSQVEVDQQVTNLTRFNIFFPERRTFFLENDDIFSNYGAPPFRPFFSRRIGLDQNNLPIPILYGTRISGNINETLRIGAFNMQTNRSGDFAPQNYSAFSAVKRIGVRSEIKTYFHNRSSFLNALEEKLKPNEKFGRNAGLELSLSDASGKLNAWSGFHLSQKPNISGQNTFHQLGAGYFGEKVNAFIDYAGFGNNYHADMGFINRIETFSTKGAEYSLGDTTIRMGFKQAYNENSYFIRPENGNIVNHTFLISNFFNWFNDNSLSDRSHTISYAATFKNTSNFRLGINLNQDNLRYYFPLPTIRPLTPGKYNYTNLNFEYKTDNRKNVLWTSGARLGQYYNGFLQQFTNQLTLRQQPYWSVAILAEYNNIKFPEKYGTTKLWLISPKTEINFSNKLFWTTFFQFNTQRNNFNINSRLQYRYSPMSDLFLVYSDNYFTDPFLKNKNRALILKFNYWLTM
jgi:hypothetical protein